MIRSLSCSYRWPVDCPSWDCTSKARYQMLLGAYYATSAVYSKLSSENKEAVQWSCIVARKEILSIWLMASGSPSAYERHQQCPTWHGQVLGKHATSRNYNMNVLKDFFTLVRDEEHVNKRDSPRGKAGRCKLVWLSAIPSLLCRSVYIYPYTYISDGARRCCTSRIDPAGRRAGSVALRS